MKSSIKLTMFLALILAGCASEPKFFSGGTDDVQDGGSNMDNSTDTETGSDTDTSTSQIGDGGTDGDTDSDTGTDSDQDSGIGDIDTDSDTDTDTVTETETVTDTDTDTEADGGVDSDTDTETDDPECEGVLFEGACWFYAAVETSCDETCQEQVSFFDSRTCSIAGSSPAICEAILDLLEVPLWEMYECDCAGLGCHSLNETRGLSDTCDSSSSGVQRRRVCACTF